MLLQIIIGLIGATVGFLVVWRPQFFLELVGEQVWMEKLFGPGHGISGFKVIGVIIVIVSFLIMTGQIEGIILWFFSPIMKFNR